MVTAVLLGALSMGCPATEDEPCLIDSDCSGGLVCGLAGVCTTFDKVDDEFNAVPDVTVITLDTGGGETSTGPDTISGNCTPPVGSWPCDGVDKRVVALFEIDSEGHGAAGLAGASQLILPDGFADGSLYMEWWIDGTFQDDCPYKVGYVRDDNDVDGSCQPIYTSDEKMPVTIPGIVELFVYDPTFTPSTGQLRGFVDKDEIVAALAPALRDAFSGMVQEDVDTDGDGTPDLATFSMTVTFK